MTENESINIDECLKELKSHRDTYLKRSTPWRIVNRAIRLIEQYRALGTIAEIIGQQYELQTYQAIGTVEEFIEAKASSEWAHEDLKAYKEIGTAEEFKALKEKRTAKSRRIVAGKYFCPECGRTADMGYCKACGQNLY